MKINLAKSAGFCFGVKRAIDIATKIAREKQPVYPVRDYKATGKKQDVSNGVYMLGDIVHNEDVVRNLARLGISRVKNLSRRKKGVLLIAAHGTAADLLGKAKQRGYEIVDATCPMVKEIHRIAVKMDRQGYRIIIIGDKNHAEVIGIAGQIRNKSIIIEDSKETNSQKLNGVKKAAVVVQSTQDAQKVSKIRDALKKKIDDLRFFDTICSPTKIKQREIRTLPKENDVVIVIGSKKSANTKRLYQIAKSINKNTHWINNKNEIKRQWFENAESAGVTAGASTPFESITSAIERIKSITQ
ncbi:MAG: 4-hydroxy-3-methylbut-2-enyl diphosphate reductase [Candidatus Omnitrophota bacterium]